MSAEPSPACEGCGVREGMQRRAFMRAALAAVGALTVTARSALAITIVRGESHAAEKAYPLPAADSVAIDRDESVIVANFGGKAYAFSLACPHQNTVLRWDADEHRYKCPKHHSRYEADGSFIDGRATRGMDRFAIRRDGNQLFVNLDALYRQDENAGEWATAFVSVA